MSLRSYAAAQTRERLLDEALTLFLQHGYAATSVRDILKAAQVTQPTLYYHFADKASLFRALIEKHYGDSQSQLEQTVDFNSAVDDRLLAFAVTSFEYCCVDSRVPRLMFQTHFGPTVPEIDGILDQLINCRFRIVTRVMENGIQNKELAPSAPEFWRSVSAV